jgi:hypothetical protein
MFTVRACVGLLALGAAALGSAGCAMPVSSGSDDGVTSNGLTGGEEAQIGASPDTSGDGDGRGPRNPGPSRMTETGPGHEPDPSPWAGGLQVGVIVSPPPSGGAPNEEPDPSPWMHKVDSASR